MSMFLEDLVVYNVMSLWGNSKSKIYGLRPKNDVISHHFTVIRSNTFDNIIMLINWPNSFLITDHSFSISSASLIERFFEETVIEISFNYRYLITKYLAFSAVIWFMGFSYHSITFIGTWKEMTIHPSWQILTKFHITVCHGK